MGREEDMEELSLELSIGGKYGKAENSKRKSMEFCAENADCETDPQRRREIQALRRQEARRKREEKVKKSRGLNAGFVDDRLLMEAQRSEARVRDREIKEKDCLFEGKMGKNGSGEVADELALSLFSEKKCLYPKVQFASSSIDCDSEYSNGVKSLEQCSSAVSDYRSISFKGGSCSDTGSDSSSLLPRRRHGGDLIETNGSHGGAKPAPTGNPQPTWMKPTEVPNGNNSPGGANVSCTSEKTSGGGGGVNNPPPRAAGYGTNAGCFPRMPCVSATGNGPNGKTVMGFLYRYNKTEVSIMCICHRSLLTPAEFVEHAGSVDVCHPLKHITVVPPAARW